MKNYTAITVCSGVAYIFLIIGMNMFYPNATVLEVPMWFWVISICWGLNFIVWVFFGIRQILD